MTSTQTSSATPLCDRMRAMSLGAPILQEELAAHKAAETLSR